MSSIAKAVGISNGLIFKYFKTKETLFLSLLWREYEKRLDYLEAETEKTDFRDFSDVQELLLSELEHLLYQNPVYIKLESMRSIILEKNADTQLLLKMKEKFYGRVNAWSRKFSLFSYSRQRRLKNRVSLVLKYLNIKQLEIPTALAMLDILRCR